MYTRQPCISEIVSMSMSMSMNISVSDSMCSDINAAAWIFLLVVKFYCCSAAMFPLLVFPSVRNYLYLSLFRMPFSDWCFSPVFSLAHSLIRFLVRFNNHWQQRWAMLICPYIHTYNAYDIVLYDIARASYFFLQPSNILACFGLVYRFLLGSYSTYTSLAIEQKKHSSQWILQLKFNKTFILILIINLFYFFGCVLSLPLYCYHSNLSFDFFSSIFFIWIVCILYSVYSHTFSDECFLRFSKGPSLKCDWKRCIYI